MKIFLSDIERDSLLEEQIVVDPEKEYSIDEALALLEEVSDVEAMYSNLPENDRRAAKADAFAHLADKIYAMIPEI